ncbi:MAG: LysM peptidoglycan-binding domain-containing protein [Candidatus Doudnabacteria bacterium]|nr:LysM peptidoglycan-binding domain-containing protein [Candidatus Doudnabacteria bacterium]
MRYIRPHLSPEIRAQISPETRRDRHFIASGVVFLVLSLALTFNLFGRNSASPTYNKIELAQVQSESQFPEKQILGASTKEADENPKEEFTSYVVKNGDTLFNISQQYGIRWDLIAQLNGLSEPYILHAGQNLKIPQATTSKVEGKIYTIKKGDTLASIARSFNITVDDIIAVNPNLQKSDLITVGQVIRLP